MTDIMPLLRGEVDFVRIRDCSICGVAIGYHMPMADIAAVLGGE